MRPPVFLGVFVSCLIALKSAEPLSILGRNVEQERK